MTTIQNKPVNPIDHLAAEDIENLGKDLDAIRQQVLDTRGERDATYIRRVITAQRTLEASSRIVLLFSLLPPAWLAGTAGLSVAKILENMEIGHNVLHGQWDWMRDPKIHSTTWEWDNASPAEHWKHAHNEEHHTYTNVIARTVTSATASCGSTRSSRGIRFISVSRCGTLSTPSCSNTASPPTTSNLART